MPRTTEAPRARLSGRQAETVRRLTEAAVEEVAEHRYEGLTVRGVAKRAGVAPATAYTYFASKNHLLAEVFWRRLRDLPEPDPLPGGSPADRAAEALSAVALLVADDPALSAACTTAMLADEPNVLRLRARIGLRVHERISGATDASPAALQAFELAFYGALVQAGMGHLSYRDLPDLLATTARTIFPRTEECP
ncbi:helix-turn-helix domain-containing protein [Streptosporangium sp. NPDC049248]|uniref:TetR/AcrR family transcriptional regulator n=1 Tax=unclassified Streptosporangium TaxID=2632669 RepID=UPI00344253DC